MAEKKNFQLSDEMLFGATGGLTAAKGDKPDYDAIGSVIMNLGGKQYQVRFDDGAELIATYQSGGEVLDGTKVGLYAIAGGWTMYVLGS
jgi:hypothetical protein